MIKTFKEICELYLDNDGDCYATVETVLYWYYDYLISKYPEDEVKANWPQISKKALYACCFYDNRICDMYEDLE